MYTRQIVAQEPVRDVLRHPAHPITWGLLTSVMRADGAETPGIPGSPPNLHRPPSGCAFAPRCPAVVGACTIAVPAERVLGLGRTARFIRAGELVAV